eukprot:363940-Chlamydomonas_euryale.AAC.4
MHLWVPRAWNTKGWLRQTPRRCLSVCLSVRAGHRPLGGGGHGYHGAHVDFSTRPFAPLPCYARQAYPSWVRSL